MLLTGLISLVIAVVFKLLPREHTIAGITSHHITHARGIQSPALTCLGMQPNEQ